MNPEEFLNFLIDFSPDFKADWYGDDNYSISDDGSFTFHGICAEYSHFFIDQEKHKYITLHDIKWKRTIPDSKLTFLFEWIENNIDDVETKESLETNEGLLSNALCTCFLENISQTNAGEYAKNFMGKKSRRYFDFWHVYEKRL